MANYVGYSYLSSSPENFSYLFCRMCPTFLDFVPVQRRICLLLLYKTCQETLVRRQFANGRSAAIKKFLGVEILEGLH